MEQVKLIGTSYGAGAAEPCFLLVELCKLFTGDEPPEMKKRVVFLHAGERHEVVVPFGEPVGVKFDDVIVEAEPWQDAQEYVWRSVRKKPEILNHVTATCWFKGQQFQDVWRGLLPHHSDAVGKDVLVTARVNFWLEFADQQTAAPPRFCAAVKEAANQIRKVFGLERKEQSHEAPTIS